MKLGTPFIWLGILSLVIATSIYSSTLDHPDERIELKPQVQRLFLVAGVFFILVGLGSYIVLRPNDQVKKPSSGGSGRVLEIVCSVWGGVIVASAPFLNWGHGSYLTGQIAAVAFGAVMLFAGLISLARRSQITTKHSPCPSLVDEIGARTPITDDAMYQSYFSSRDVDPGVAARVRDLCGQQFRLPRQKLLPDDDFTAILSEEDMDSLIRNLEKVFHITIANDDAVDTECTIRSIATLVQRLRNRQRA